MRPSRVVTLFKGNNDMLWSYEDEEMNVTGNSSDIKYDAEVMSDFTDALCHDMDTYRDRSRLLESGYVKYHNNDTFVGEMADKSKEFIYDVQGDMHERNLELKKEFLNMCLSIENKFKEEIDPSPKARISVETLSKIKSDFNVCYNSVDTKGYELECHAKELVNVLGKWGVSTVPYYRRSMYAFDEFCGHGKSLDKSIKKLENFDQEACALMNRLDIEGAACDLQRNITHTAGVLDSMTVYQPTMTKNSISIVALSAMGAVKNSPLDVFKKLLAAQKKSDPVVITDPKYLETMVKEFGFTEEQATLLYEAYVKFEKKYPIKVSKEWNDKKIKYFYSNLAALNPGYSSEDKLFKLMAVTPSTRQAVAFFNSLGVDGAALKEAVNDQHSTCEKNQKRDFVHECAIFAIMSEKHGTKEVAGFVDDVDALIGYKGDVYSGKMGIDDKKSDVQAYNIYYRMRESKDGDIWAAMSEYNEGVCEGKINGSREFLAHFGNGDPRKGMDELKKELDRETTGTKMLKGDPDDIQRTKKEFLYYISKESGIK